MNLVGKIFTVLIFLMCVVFGTFALMVHAAHKNWKVEVVDLSQKLTEANKLKADLTEEKKNLQTALDDEKARTRARLIALERAKEKAEADKNEMEAKIQIEEGRSRQLAMAIKEVHNRLSVLQTAIDGMRSDIKVAIDERNKTQASLLDTTDKLMNAVAERERLEKLGRDLAARKLKLEEALQYAKVTADKNAPVDLEGEVTSVVQNAVETAVEISVGADDGVRKGHTFQVFRPSAGTLKYIGVIVVTRVDYPNRAVCSPDKSLQTAPIQKGDHVKARTIR